MDQGRQDQRLQARLGLVMAWRTIGLLSSISLGLCLATFATTRAQDFPARPVRLIVNFPAGSGTADTVARALSEYLTHKWGQPVTVDNIPGSTGVVGAEAAYRAEPDGYTLLVTPAGALTVAQHLQKLAYDPAQFVPISMLETSRSCWWLRLTSRPRPCPS
jgi:tripartite-type tricarboxylate transporter receptor subunit TctC